MKANKINELPLEVPFYSTLHFQGLAGAVIHNNPSIRNWYINESMVLSCSKSFLNGFSSPNIGIVNSCWTDNPNFERQVYQMRFLNGYINHLIRELIDNGYYVNFDGLDDFFIEGKSWYKVRHFNHDGLIYGYNQHEKTYKIYAYDQNWIYRGFNISQKCFNKSREYMQAKGIYGTVAGVKPTNNQILLNPVQINNHLKEYLDSNFNKYPIDDIDNDALGIVVHEYLMLYIDRLYNGIIPYEKLDWRVFRMLWEQKVFMLERLQKTEKLLNFDSTISNAYYKIVKNADDIRMLYASHHKKRRDSLLIAMKNKLKEIHELEKELLLKFINMAERNILQ